MEENKTQNLNANAAANAHANPEAEGKMAFDFKTKCTKCGLCRTTCPVYTQLFDEAVSPRGKVTLMEKNMLTNHLYICTLCKACEKFCVVPGLNVVNNVMRARAEMVRFGRETGAGKRMIENIRTTGMAFKKPEGRNAEIEVFCC